MSTKKILSLVSILSFVISVSSAFAATSTPTPAKTPTPTATVSSASPTGKAGTYFKNVFPVVPSISNGTLDVKTATAKMDVLADVTWYLGTNGAKSAGPTNGKVICNLQFSGDKLVSATPKIPELTAVDCKELGKSDPLADATRLKQLTTKPPTFFRFKK